MTNVPMERCRHQTVGSFGSGGANDKRLPSSIEVPFGACLPAPEGQVPSYEKKMLFSSPYTPIPLVTGFFSVSREISAFVGPVLCPPFVSIPSKDPFNFQPQCPSINRLCSVLGGVPLPSSLGWHSSCTGVFLIICPDLWCKPPFILSLGFSYHTLHSSRPHSTTSHILLSTWCSIPCLVLSCNLHHPPPITHQSLRKLKHPPCPL